MQKAYKVDSFGSAAAVQEEIQSGRPVEATFDVYADFTYYKSGVYQHVTGDFMGKHSIKHAIKIIGWGEQGSLKFWLAAWRRTHGARTGATKDFPALRKVSATSNRRSCRVSGNVNCWTRMFRDEVSDYCSVTVVNH